jgi:hypothetical protein
MAYHGRSRYRTVASHYKLETKGRKKKMDPTIPFEGISQMTYGPPTRPHLLKVQIFFQYHHSHRDFQEALNNQAILPKYPYCKG